MAPKRQKPIPIRWLVQKEVIKDTMTTPTLLLEEQMQNERFARAQTALWRGDMRVQALDACTWTVASKENQYIVRAEGDGCGPAPARISPAAASASAWCASTSARCRSTRQKRIPFTWRI